MALAIGLASCSGGDGSSPGTGAKGGSGARGGTLGTSGGKSGSGGMTGAGGVTGNGGSVGGAGGGMTGNGGSVGGAGGGAAGSAGTGGAGGAAPVAFKLTSKDVTDGDKMPPQFTCNGNAFASGDNPELTWTAGPPATKSYAIVLKDLTVIENNLPTASAYNRGFHWIIWDIPTTGPFKISSGMGDAEFPPEVPGARQWANRNQFGYFPPCPNSDPNADPATWVTDNYSLTLYAFDKAILDYPPMASGVTNYSRTLHDYIESVAIAKTQLRFVSDARSNAAPPAVDPSTIKYPSARLGAGGAGGARGAGGAAGAGGANEGGAGGA